MKKLLALLAFLAIGPAVAQNAGWPPPAGAVAFLGVYNSAAPTLTTGQIGFAQLDASGNLNVNVKAGSGSGCAGTVGTPCVVAGTAGSGSALAGAPVRIGLSDGTNAQNWLAAIALGDAVNGNNTGAVAAWAWNGTTYDRLQVDASKYLKVNCSAGCAGGSFNNNADGVATSSTNGQTASWPYLWNGASWDRQYGDKTNGAWVNVKTSVLPTGAATSANQTNASQKTQIVDGSGNVIASTSNNLNVQCANCSGSGVSTADEASFTASASLFAGTGGFYQTTATSNALTNEQQGMLQLTAQRAAFANLRNASGTEVGTSSAPLSVTVANTGANATAMLVTGTGGTFPVSQATSSNLKAQVDPLTIATWGLTTIGAGTAPTNAQVGGLIYNSSPPSPTTGQSVALQGDSSGNLKVNVASATGLAQGSTTSSQTGSLVMGAVTTAPPSYTTAQTSPISLDTAGNTRVAATPYPSGATPYTATATGTTGATTATLTGAASVTTYLCGFSIRANATAAATGNATVTGVITATMNFTQWTAPNASGLGVTEEIFQPCIPASATNTSIAVVSAAPGTGGVVSVTAWGYKL